MPQGLSLLSFEIDHVIARQHGGKTIAGNLVHPRRHKWRHHFRWDGPVLVGRTPIGRATIDVLAINHPLRIEQRRALIDARLFPPSDA